MHRLTFRQKYVLLQRRACSARGIANVTPAQFNQMVFAKLREFHLDPKTARQDQFVQAARMLRYPCHACAASGELVSCFCEGECGPARACHWCDGKGFQTDEDFKRSLERSRWSQRPERQSQQ